MADDLVNVEVDGVAVKAKKNEMIIRVTDAHGAYVPRFCYHDKLPIAANCRMCLVEVEKAPKPIPACATPVAEGMKIFTKSPKAIAAQKATMEFLLINHPLDCPICDQGGECELQDLAMGFGRDIARYNERKRVVKDKNLGPLVATDMTRCIHCTRCVRFGQDVAGIQELGTTGRGENTEIGTYIERSVDHELSGNIIDLCPVGALTSKPFRFQGRSWEMTQHGLVSPHDGVGSNLYAHVLRGKLLRIVPRQNDDINETWLSDRDRFSYEGVYAADRATTPLLRDGTEWKAVSWEVALEAAAKGLKRAGAGLGTLVSASATVEEQYLAAKITRALGSNDVDHRLRQSDFRGQGADALHPALGHAVAATDELDALLVVGSNLRREVPVLAHRVRKAARRGAKVSFVNPATYPYLFPVANYVSSTSAALEGELAAVLAAVAEASGKSVPDAVASRVKQAKAGDAHRAIAATFVSAADGAKKAIWLGALAIRHAAWSDLRALAAALADLTGATLGELAEGANAAGAYLAGAVPHRGVGGASLQGAAGRDARAMLEQPQKGYLLVGAVEPWADSMVADAAKSLARSEFVVAVTPYASDALKQVAHVILPIGTFAESSGTYVNLSGIWQSFGGSARAVGESRPAWKVLRVLGNLLALPGFDYESSEDVRDELRAAVGSATAPASRGAWRPNGAVNAAPVTDWPMYQVDAVVRRAGALQRTAEARLPAKAY